MKRLIAIVPLVVIVCTNVWARNLTSDINGDVELKRHAPNIVSLRADSIVMVGGTTSSYCVDTAIGQGLISTGLLREHLESQLTFAKDLQYRITNSDGTNMPDGYFASGDKLLIGQSPNERTYNIVVHRGALSPTLSVEQRQITVDTPTDISIHFTAGQRTPGAIVNIYIPKGIEVTADNTTVNVIGRGEVALGALSKQSIGRTGSNYPFDKVGEVSICRNEGGTKLTFTQLDLRPHNGTDLLIKIKGVRLPVCGNYTFDCDYTTAAPEIHKSYRSTISQAKIECVQIVSDFRRDMPKEFSPEAESYLSLTLRWSAPATAGSMNIISSTDQGQSWTNSKKIAPTDSSTQLTGLLPDKLYLFKLKIDGGDNEGESNVVRYFSGMFEPSTLGIKGDGITDDTRAINEAIEYINDIGGGVLSLSRGTYAVRTVLLRNNVWIFVGSEGTVSCIGNCDEPETSWFSDRAYRSGLSPTDTGPYAEPENYLTKQDVGHTFFRNAMFFAQRQRNIRIVGNGLITGNGKLGTSDKIMNNPKGSRADKMFSLKLCEDIEIGGLRSDRDLWYDPDSDRPYYINGDGTKDYAVQNMLHIERGGHFVLLATGTDNIDVHNTLFGTEHSGNARDIYDFMGCNNINVSNIYSKVSSDDIVKLGSDCSLGFTRKAKNYMVRNIIGDTNCNLFQIGSETADDICDIWIDNIYVLAANKAGFSISTNDGGDISNVFLNSGRTGRVFARSVMNRTRTPFFISISNRGRVIGADVERFAFTENGAMRDELLCTNVSIGSIDNVILNDVDVSEVYGASSYGNRARWAAYDGTQNEAAPIISGYSLPDSSNVQGALTFRLPDGAHRRYISDICFNRINIKVKGAHPKEHAALSPPQLGVGRYNVSDMKTLPAYGYWFRHVKNLRMKDCRVMCEVDDNRHAIVLDDVHGALIQNATLPDGTAKPSIREIKSSQIIIR